MAGGGATGARLIGWWGALNPEVHQDGATPPDRGGCVCCDAVGVGRCGVGFGDSIAGPIELSSTLIARCGRGSVIGRAPPAGCVREFQESVAPGAAHVVPTDFGSRHPPELVIDPGPDATACLVAWSTGVPVKVVRSCATPSRCRPVNWLVHDPTPVLLVVKLQMSENTPGVAKRPLTTTVYSVSSTRPVKRNEEVHSVLGSSPEVPLT